MRRSEKNITSPFPFPACFSQVQDENQSDPDDERGEGKAARPGDGERCYHCKGAGAESKPR